MLRFRVFARALLRGPGSSPRGFLLSAWLWAALLGPLLTPGVADAQEARVERWLAGAERAMERGRSSEALRLWRRAARRAPEDGRAVVRMASALPQGAPAVVNVEGALRARALEAQRLLDAHLEVAEGEAREARRARAWVEAVLGDHPGAIEAATGMAGLQDAESASLLRNLATLAVLRDDLPSAERALLAARRASPQDGEIHSELGALALARGAPERAVEHFGRALGRAPGDLDARRDLAGALLAAGRADEALGLLTRAIAAHPEAPALRLELARAALEAGQPDVAERAARQAVALLPTTDPRAHSLLGEAFAARDRPDLARAAFEEALRRAPRDLRARMGLDALTPPR